LRARSRSDVLAGAVFQVGQAEGGLVVKLGNLRDELNSG
jgi:hypothetical protein